MKKFLAVLALICFMAVPAFAVDKIINSKIDSATVAIDKNGNQYVRLIINEARKVQGVSYDVGVPVMAFGKLAKKAKGLKAGDQLKAVVASREYRGNTSYTIRAFLKQNLLTRPSQSGIHHSSGGQELSRPGPHFFWGYRMVSKIKSALTIIALYITVVGLITFANFILEEAIQMATFGTWPAKTAQNWELVLEGCDIITGINTTMSVINYAIGWIQPLAFLSYRAYAKSTDYYVKALKSQAFANAPEAFIGRNVRFRFTPKTIQHKADHIRLINRRIHVIVDKMPESKSILVQGRLEQQGKVFVIDTR